MAELKSNPAVGAFSITPSDTVLLRDGTGGHVTRGIYVGVTGNLCVMMADDSIVTFLNVAVGVLPIQAKMVYDTDTTATELIGLY